MARHAAGRSGTRARAAQAARGGAPSPSRPGSGDAALPPVADDLPPPPPDDEPPVSDDYVDLAASARRQRRSVGRLRALVEHSIRLTWAADRRAFVVTTVLQLFGAAVIAAQVLIVKAVLDAILVVGDGGGVGPVVLPVVLLATITALVAVASAIQTNQQRLLSELVLRSTWQQLLDVAGAVGLRAFESPEFYDRLQRVQTNALSRPYQLTQGLVGLAGGLAGCIGLSIAIVSFEPALLPILLLAGVPLFFSTRRESRLEFDFAVAQTPRLRLRQYLGLVQTGRDEAKEVRAYGLTGALRARFDAVYSAYTDDLRVHLRRRTRLAVAGNLASAVFLAATLLALVWLVGQGRVTLAEAGAAIVAIRLLATQVGTLFKGAQQIFESGLFLDDLDRFVAMRPEAEQAESGAPAPASFGALHADGLSFTYPGSTAPALDDVSIRLNAGEIVALVGENGSGKTTLAKLLATLYEPDGGTIRWDGVDVAAYSRPGLRRSVAVVFQDFVRYHLSARENVGLGDADRMDEIDAIAAAARRAGVADVIQDLPHGWDTALSRMFKGGRDLSLGQWQRVALARAFFRDAPFVILDEPSASLDPRAEHALFQSLRDLLGGRTVLFISHRFSTVRTADRIYVLSDGRVTEHGSHDELMARDGHYAELFRLQAAAYLSPEASH
ncbi:ABC transporter ATP-binding protein [Jiangella sp. DSM 45060]|uniref:ABC transporter ATP-binding protein n=1 Tax=Jiangella sp. DSM 45060 TaxID=1798224 RepID=UPI00087A17C5|nr:ABC transporter ATP-binding protein [Jiangella sp. DSM 45060]SDT59068.1 ATP-binding cassette, subfamily B [Jiangella sp. DSM 45060]